MRREIPEDVLAAFPGKQVLIVGDVMLDEYVYGEVRRISPEAPIPVVRIRRRDVSPGGAANSAANVASLGGRAILGGVLGADVQADQLREALGRQSDLDTAGLVVDPGRPTTIKTRIVAHNQQVVRADIEECGPLAARTEQELLRWVDRRLPEADACVISDYDKGVVSPRLARHVIQLGIAAGVPVVVDSKRSDYTRFRGATVLTPNVQEVERVMRREIEDESQLLDAGLNLLELLHGSAVLITRGPRGMLLLTHRAAALRIPTAARQVFDVTGAGDTVAGTLALALAAGADLEQAARLASEAAGIVVSKVGTATATLEELSRELPVHQF